MTVESLMVKLEANVKDYLKDMEKAEKQNKETGKSGKALAAGIVAVGAAAGPAVIAIAALTAGTAALGLALGSVIRDTAMNVREFENLSRQAKLTVDDFKAVTFATTTLGVSAEQFADISKDVADKMGEYANVGTGAFQDFVDVMGMGKDEGQALAREMENLSSPQVLGNLVSMMQDAGISSNEMTFVMESMGNELSRLIPLFTDQSTALNEMVTNYELVNDTLRLTTEEAQNLQSAGVAFDLLSASMQSAKEKVAAQVSPAITGFINELIEKVPRATEAVSDLLEYFGLGESTIGDEIDTPEVPQVGGVDDSGERQAEIDEARAERMAEILEAHLLHNEELLESDYAYYMANVEAYQQMLDEKLISEETYNKEFKRLTRERGKAYQEEAKEQQKWDRIKLNNMSGYISAAQTLSNAFFEDNKAIAAGLIIADTAAAIMKSLSVNPYDWGNVAVIAATGLVQLSNALGAQKGGGSTSGATGGATGVSVQNNQSDFVPETTSLEVSSTIEGEGASVQTVKIDNDNLDDLAVAIARQMKSA